MLSPKDIYERVREHLLAQRAVSEDDNGSCRLRSAHGRKCAIGSLVRDDVYETDLEGVGISYYRHAQDGKLLRALYASNVNAYDPNVIDLLIELEQVHDDASVDEWPHLLAALGRRHAFV
ncbi:hypothetical protein [Caballeronia concitans]|uniref:Uncharacterized protein n=1 Tax=Caballeronia concitans TaxID=1777133 RepID=A0A658QQZ2_9BURK|nr:hypothetical protein [Caballeronia concitans]KIG02410.1 hypothetical protein BurMR1_5459 [Burkholderia sp. MR1]SAL11888.1 hypothetical protein AWB72_00369 [Caballeronia concitans]